MITLQPPASTLIPDNYLATKRTVESVELKIQDATSCRSFSECFDYSLPVFANLANPEDTLTNDFSSFMVQFGNNTLVVGTLTDKVTGVTYIITDNTYGKLFNFLEIGVNNFGFRIDWYNVASLIGFSKFEFKIELSNVTTGDVFYTECNLFQLMPFTCKNANGTVRITTGKSGYIENGNDYRFNVAGVPTNVRWFDQIRLYGKLESEQPTTEIDNLQLNNGELYQIQTKIIDNFNLRLDQLSSFVSNSFIKDDLLANRMFIDDYNANNVDDYKQKYVSLVNIDAPIKHKNNGSKTYNIKMTEFKQTTLKRNF